MSETPLEAALAAYARGEMVVVFDDETRENEGDLILAAQKATPETIAFMVRHTSGLLCVALTGERLDALRIPLMVPSNTERMRTAFTVSVDAIDGTTTGISAVDRATTVRALVDPGTQAADLARPGHVFPLRARSGGVLERPGHTEAAVDLARLSGLSPGGVLAEILLADGSLARRPELEDFAVAHGLAMIDVADLVSYRRTNREVVRRLDVSHLSTRFGEFTAYAFESVLRTQQHVALVYGDTSLSGSPLVHVHSECLSGDVFGSRSCDCSAQLQAALQMIGAAGGGIVIYLRGRENARAGIDDHDHDYAAAAAILAALGVERVRLLTDNPRTCTALAGHGLEVADRVSLQLAPTADDDLRMPWDCPAHVLELG